MTLAHGLSIDVEDYFQVLNLRGVVARADWDRTALRCGDSTRRLLDLLHRRGARATFFFLGWIVERLPELARDVLAAGHEVGSHGYDHQLLGELGPQGFASDLRRTEDLLVEACGQRPTSFRACTWSITKATSWALPMLIERGYDVDSSIFPVRHPDYGMPAAPADPYRLRVGSRELVEVPPLTWRVLGRRVPVGGGGYLRLLPLPLVELALRQRERAGLPACVYLHPWEVDPEQPRQPIGGLRGFRHYVNLRQTLPKLDRLLQRHRFVGVAESVAAVIERLPVVDLEALAGRPAEP